MRVVAFAYHNAGVFALERLRDLGGDVAMVYTHEDPDERAWHRSVRRYCERHGIPCQVPGEVDAGVAEEVREIDPDLIVSCYARFILPPEVLDVPTWGAVNVHPSLLPRFRGCFSAPWAIIHGQDETGVSVHEMEASIDTGDILGSTTVPIRDDDTGFTLYRRLQDRVPDVLEEVVEGIRADDVQREAQDPDEGEYFPRAVPYDGVVDWTRPAREVRDFVRAIAFRIPPDGRDGYVGGTPIHPAAEARWRGELLQVWRVRAQPPPSNADSAVPGEIVGFTDDRTPVVQTGLGCLALEQVQPDGHLEMYGSRFAEVFDVEIGDQLAGGRWDPAECTLAEERFEPADAVPVVEANR